MSTSEASVKIENVVASATLNQRVDLNAIVKGYRGVSPRTVSWLGLSFEEA
jgi:TATA-box binding protein (TBP) (component of TFIID and TFIIIB)